MKVTFSPGLVTSKFVSVVVGPVGNVGKVITCCPACIAGVIVTTGGFVGNTEKWIFEISPGNN